MSIYSYLNMEGETEKDQSIQAISYTLKQISTNPDVKDLIGPGTQTFDLLTEAYATLIEKPVVDIRKEFY